MDNAPINRAINALGFDLYITGDKTMAKIAIIIRGR
jgi:hypothetical protein